MSDLVTVEKQGHLLMIGVDRQDKRNAWNREIIAGVAEAYTQLRDDSDLRVGVVFGHGANFSAGLDLMDVLPAMSEGSNSILPSGLCDPWDYIGEPTTKPVVVAVQGKSYTLTIELILAAQVAVAATDTEFAQLEVARGIVPFGGGTFRLPELGAQGMRWLLSAEPFGAQEALEAGLINEVVEPGKQVERAVEIAETIAANAPLAVQASLANTRATVREARDRSAAHIVRSVAPLIAGEDAMEGMNAMMEKRPPNFKGA